MKNLSTIVDPEDPFANCKLEREPYADILTDIIRTNSDGFVLAIDNKWGAGKTTFVSMWKQKLQNNDYQTLYFNAWENDFENNPFVAITAELKELLKNETSENFKEVIKKGSKISKAVIPSVMKALIKRYAGEEVADIMKDYSEGVLEAFQDDIDLYVERKKNIIDFHEELEKYIAENSNDNPIVFIIDELDRCRPDYAVSLLENVKHLFSVKGIVFILTIDKEQLGHAICGAYGSDNIDANEYLRRFIDIEYSLPQPKVENYVRYLIDACKLSDFFNLEVRKNREFTNEQISFKDFACFFIQFKNINLRQQEKIMIHVGLVLRSFNGKAFILPELLFYLIYLKMFEGEFYTQIKRKQFTHQNLLERNKEVLKGNLNNENGNNWRVIIEANLISCYNQYLDYGDKVELEKQDNKEFPVFSYFDTSSENATFIHYVSKRMNSYIRTMPSIDYLLKKIDLTESLKDL